MQEMREEMAIGHIENKQHNDRSKSLIINKDRDW